MIFRRSKENRGPTPGGSPLGSARALFLLGAPRSGTTLLCRILNAHPRLLMTNESAVFLQLAEAVEKSRGGSKLGVVYGKQYHERWSDFLDRRARGLIEDYYADLAATESRRDLAFWGEKHPHFVSCLDWLGAHWPQASYVYLVRDPRDAACSIGEMTGKGAAAGLEVWRNFTRTTEAFLAKLPESRKFFLRYEDLVADYAACSERLLRALGLAPDPAVSKHIERFRDVDAHRLSASVVSGLQRGVERRDFAATAVGRSAREMSAADLTAADALVGEWLDRYGYARAAATR